MNCSDYARWIPEKIDGSLRRDRLEELDRHLRQCRRCQAELLLQRKIVESLMEDSPSGLSARFTERVLERVGRITRTEPRGQRWPALIPVLASTAIAIVVFMFRAGLAEVIGPRMERFGAKVAAPVTSFDQNTLGLAAKVTDLTGRSISLAESAPPISINMVVAVLIACVAVIWAFYKASVLLRQ